MKTLKFTVGIILGVLILFATFSFVLQKKTNPANLSSAYSVEKVWELPDELNEISGIAWLDATTIAGVQDEKGIIFIYDLTKNKIVEQIEFAGSGDYEGIAIHKKDAYVLRSDGVIFEVLLFRESGKSVNTFETGFSAKNNMETLELDVKNNALIVAPKDRDNSDDFKGLYRIPLDSKTMIAEPGIKINMNDKALEGYKKKKAHKTFNPSDVAIHPKTGEYFVLEGIQPKLLILTKDGTIKKVHDLDKTIFAQPEGITFSPDGTLYISNESGDNAANIVKVSF